MGVDTTKHKLVLAKLTKKQIAEAEKANGDRKTFTHAVICGPWGQILGTETTCRKYYNTWKRIFPLLFDGAMERSRYQIDHCETTFGLVEVLSTESQKRERATNPVWQDIQRGKKVREARAAHQAAASTNRRHPGLLVVFVVFLLLLAASVFAEDADMQRWGFGDFGPHPDQKNLPFINGNKAKSKAFAKRNAQNSTELNVLAQDGRCASEKPMSGVHFVLVNNQEKIILLSFCRSAGVRQYHPEGSGSSYPLTQAFESGSAVTLNEIGADHGWPPLNVEFLTAGFKESFRQYNKRTARIVTR